MPNFDFFHFMFNQDMNGARHLRRDRQKTSTICDLSIFLQHRKPVFFVKLFSDYMQVNKLLPFSQLV